MEKDLERARRFVAEGEARVGLQEELILDLRRNGFPTAKSRELLAVLKDTLHQYRRHLELLEQEAGRKN